MFVFLENGCAFFPFDGHGNNFILEAAGLNGGLGTLLRGERELVLLFARDFVLLCQHLGGFAHHHLGHGTKESVAVHAVHQILIAQAHAPARTLHIIRKTRHGFGATGEHAIEIALRDFFHAQRDGLHPRGAGHVDGVGGNLFRDTRADGNLAGDVGASAGLARVAEDSLLHLRGRDGSALHRGLGSDRAHVGGSLRGQ